MNFDEETLIEIEDYINALHEQVGLDMNTLVDIDKAIGKKRKELKNLPIHGVSDSTLDELVQCADCNHKHTKAERIRKSDGTWETYHCPECDSESYYTL